MSEKQIPAGMVGPGEYAPAGEAQGINERFAASEVAAALGVAIERVHRASNVISVIRLIEQGPG